MGLKNGIDYIRLERVLKKYGVDTLQELSIRRDLGLLSLSNADSDYLDEMQKTCSITGNENQNCVAHDFNNDGLLNVDDYSDSKIISSVGSLWKEKSSSQRNFMILIDYYNNRPKITLQILGDRYGLTRERVRQIISNGTEKLRGMCDKESIKTILLPMLDYFANEAVMIDSLAVEDRYFTNRGIAYLFSMMYPQRYEVFINNRLYGEWWIKPDGNLNKLLHILLKDLKNKTDPMSLNDLEGNYSINTKMGLRLDGVVEKNGYIALVINKEAMKKLDENENSRKSKNKNLAKSSLPDEVYIKKYNSNSGVLANSDDGTIHNQGSLMKAIMQVFRDSPNKLFDYRVIQRILRKKYGNRMLHDLASIKQNVAELESKKLIEKADITGYYVFHKPGHKIKEEEKLKEFIRRHIGKEIELRYKTFQPSSDKLWRHVLVNGQNEQFVFARQLYGKNMCYDKRRIIEYREPLEKYF